MAKPSASAMAVPFIKPRRKNIVCDPPQMFYARQTQCLGFPMFFWRVTPNCQNGIEADLELIVFVNDMQAFPYKFKVGIHFRNKLVVFVNIIPLDLGSAILVLLVFDSGIAYRAG